MLFGVSLMVGTLVLASLILSSGIGDPHFSEDLLMSATVMLIGFPPGLLYFLHSLKKDINSKLMLTSFLLHILSIVCSLVTVFLLSELSVSEEWVYAIFFFFFPAYIVGTILQIVYFVRSKIKHSAL